MNLEARSSNKDLASIFSTTIVADANYDKRPISKREDMDASEQAVCDEIGSKRDGVAHNYATLLNNHKAAGSMAHLRGYARYETSLNPRIKALAVLTAAREAQDHRVWTVNQPSAEEAGH